MTHKKSNQMDTRIKGRSRAISIVVFGFLTAILFGPIPLSAYCATPEATVPPVAVPAQEGQTTAAPAQAAPIQIKDTGKCFLWKASSEDGKGTVFLLGSIHMLPKEVYPLPDEIEKAFAESKTLYLEIDESKSNPLEMQQLTMTKGMYLNGETLAEHISKESKEMLDKHLANLGQVALAFKVMKPWFAALSLEVFELQRLGFDPNLGLDRHFLAKALEQKKEIGELESMQAQIDLLSGLSPDLQEKFLHYTLVDLKNIEDEGKQMVEAWKEGDPDAMDSLATKTAKEAPECLPIIEKILYERNVAMAEKIAGMLNNKSPVYVVVGAAHLTGDKGVLKLLRDKGIKLEQMERSISKAQAPAGAAAN